MHLDMIDGEMVKPPFRITLKKTKWIRANQSGFLRFHVAPGEVVEKGDAIATNTSLLGRDEEVMSAPFHAAVLGMTTLPAVGPGEPIYHLGKLVKGTQRIERIRAKLPEGHPHEEVIEDLSSSMLVVAPPEMEAE